MHGKKRTRAKEHEHEVDVSMFQSNNASTATFVMHSECDDSASDFEIDIEDAWFENVRFCCTSFEPKILS